MSQGTPCSSQLIWCETRIEKLEQQLFENHEGHLIAEQRWIEELTESKANDLFAMRLLAESQAREKVLRSALETMACLGNGCHHGNSTGNLIAIDALFTELEITK